LIDKDVDNISKVSYPVTIINDETPGFIE